MDVDDENDRPTLPFFEGPVAEQPPAFDPQTERFLSDAPTWPAFTPIPLDTDAARDEGAWWAEQRRRGFRRWVTGTVAVCAGLLAAALSVPLIGS